MTTTTSRRAILAGAAFLPALTVPALAYAAHPDAELLALGKELARLIDVYEDAEKREAPNRSAWEKELARFRELDRHVPNEEYFEAGKRIDRDFPVAWPTSDDVLEMIAAPSHRIVELPAHTLDGLKVKALLARHVCGHFWRASDDDADWDHMVARSLIDAILRSATS